MSNKNEYNSSGSMHRDYDTRDIGFKQHSETDSSHICYFCRKLELIPFFCEHCGEHFCVDHHLPEKHKCGGIGVHIPYQDGKWFDRGKLPPSIEGSTNHLEKDNVFEFRASENSKNLDSKREEISSRIEGINSQKRQLIDEMNDCVDSGSLYRRNFVLDKIHTLDKEENELLDSLNTETTNILNYTCQYCFNKVSQVFKCTKCSLELCSKHVSHHSCIKVSHPEPESGPLSPVWVEPQDTPIRSLNWNAIIMIFFVIILSYFIMISFLASSNSQNLVIPLNFGNYNAEKVATPIPAPKDIFDKINEYRKQNKKYNILWSDDAYRLADFRASDIVKRNYYSHTTPDGKTVSDYIGKYNFYSTSAWGENLCKGCSDPTQIWIGRAGDREILLGGWGKGAVACESDICVFIGVNE